MGTIRKIAVVGAGAVGGYYGAKLARAQDVSFLMRRDLQAVIDHGLSIESPEGDFQIKPVAAFADTTEIGPVDLVVIALKTTSNEALQSLIPPLLKPNTILLTLQNGLGNEEFLHQHFPSQPILGGLCFVCINRGEPGVIRHIAHGRVEMGEFTETTHLAEVAALFNSAGIDCRELPNLGLARWRKLVWNVPFNGLSIAADNLDTCQILDRPELVDRTRSLMREVIAAASAQGYQIDDDFVQSNIEGTRNMGAYQPSSLIDYMAGNAVEVEAIWGEPLKRARAHGVSMPELEKLHLEIGEKIKNR
tara:strand:+ start:1779 stop:2693 length:915 start_codon:yes stop_codon:yes gene_type:complete